MLIASAVFLAASAATASPSPTPSVSPTPTAISSPVRPSPTPDATPATSPAATPSPVASATPVKHTIVACLVHAPGVEPKDAKQLAKAVLDGLASKGYGILHQDELLATLGVGSAKTVVDPLADIRVKLRDADQAYLDLNLPAADSALRDAETALTGKLGDPEVLPLLKRALERRAVVLLAESRTDAATEKLRALYILEPEYEPSKEYLAPQFRPSFESARTLAGSAPRGNVFIETNPPGADVYVDGKFVGVSPRTERMREGSHVVQVRRAAEISMGAQIRVDSSQEQKLPFVMLPENAVETKTDLARDIMTSTLPGARSQLATTVRALTRADAVAFLVLRPTETKKGKVTEVEISAEVFHGAPGAPAAKTSEVPGPVETAAARGTALSAEIATLIEAPPPPPPDPPARSRIVQHPLRFEVMFGSHTFYGPGWENVVPGPGNRRTGILSLRGGFRLFEERVLSLDLAGSLGVSGLQQQCLEKNLIGQYHQNPPDCTDLNFQVFYLLGGPHIEVKFGRPFIYGDFGVGEAGVTSTVTFESGASSVFILPPHAKGTDTQAAAILFGAAGAGIRLRDQGRLSVEYRQILGDAELPTMVADYGVKHVGVGGSQLSLVLGYRF